jgi:hypothetical protein
MLIAARDGMIISGDVNTIPTAAAGGGILISEDH